MTSVAGAAFGLALGFVFIFGSAVGFLAAERVRRRRPEAWRMWSGEGGAWVAGGFAVRFWGGVGRRRGEEALVGEGRGGPLLSFLFFLTRFGGFGRMWDLVAACSGLAGLSPVPGMLVWIFGSEARKRAEMGLRSRSPGWSGVETTGTSGGLFEPLAAFEVFRPMGGATAVSAKSML